MRFLLPVVVPALVILTSCTSSRPLGGVADPLIIRTVTVPTTVSDPEPAWNPVDSRLVMRTANGFAIINEGVRPLYLASDDKRTSAAPRWLNQHHVIFGPASNVNKLADGRVVPVTEGLTALSIGAQGVIDKPLSLSPQGYRPRVGPGLVLAQVEDRIISIPRGDKPRDFAQGFFAEPEADGPGVAWQETPVFETDWWTGRPVDTVSLVVRWDAYVTDTFPGLVAPRWAPGRRLLATQVVGQAKTTPVRGSLSDSFATTNTVIVDAPGQPPRVILSNSHDPAPHPLYDLCACTTSDGNIVLIDYTGGKTTRIAQNARMPAWSADGLRLSYHTSASDGGTSPDIKIAVLTWTLR